MSGSTCLLHGLIALLVAFAPIAEWDAVIWFDPCEHALCCPTGPTSHFAWSDDDEFHAALVKYAGKLAEAL